MYITDESISYLPKVFENFEKERTCNNKKLVKSVLSGFIIAINYTG